MRLLVDPNEGVVSSLHSALFAVCLRVNNVDAALPYIYRNVTALVNEVGSFTMSHIFVKVSLFFFSSL